MFVKVCQHHIRQLRPGIGCSPCYKRPHWFPSEEPSCPLSTLTFIKTFTEFHTRCSSIPKCCVCTHSHSRASANRGEANTTTLIHTRVWWQFILKCFSYINTGDMFSQRLKSHSNNQPRLNTKRQLSVLVKMPPTLAAVSLKWVMSCF